MAKRYPNVSTANETPTNTRSLKPRWTIRSQWLQPLMGAYMRATTETSSTHRRKFFDDDDGDETNPYHIPLDIDNLTLTNIPPDHRTHRRQLRYSTHYTSECVYFPVCKRRSGLVRHARKHTKLHVRVCHCSQMKRSFLILYGNCNSAAVADCTRHKAQSLPSPPSRRQLLACKYVF